MTVFAAVAAPRVTVILTRTPFRRFWLLSVRNALRVIRIRTREVALGATENEALAIVTRRLRCAACSAGSTARARAVTKQRVLPEPQVTSVPGTLK
jgi:hypothetical protein